MNRSSVRFRQAAPAQRPFNDLDQLGRGLKGRTVRFMAGTTQRRRRPRGFIEKLPSGSLRVKVYAGRDPLTGKDHYLREIVPAGPDAAKRAEKVRTRLQADVDARRNPRTR